MSITSCDEWAADPPPLGPAPSAAGHDPGRLADCAADVETAFRPSAIDLSDADTAWLSAPLQVLEEADEHPPAYAVTLVGCTLISLVCFVLLALAAAQR